MNRWDRWGPPQQMDDPVEQAERWLKFAKMLKDEGKPKDDKKPDEPKWQKKMFTKIELFTLIALSSLIIGPAAAMVYLNYFLHMMAQYGPIIQQMTK